MTKVLITGAKGFVAKNLVASLAQMDDVDLLLNDRDTPPGVMKSWVKEAKVIYHLAGVNRPEHDEEYQTGNTELTRSLCAALMERDSPAHIVMTSSIQAGKDNAYGRSKLLAEKAVTELNINSPHTAAIYRLTNVFGKWCKPNYNSVTATFCSNIAQGLPIQISDPATKIALVYIDDVVAALTLELLEQKKTTDCYREDSIPEYKIRLGDLAAKIQAFHNVRTSQAAPDLSSRFNQALYATYLSYVPIARLEYGLDIRADSRGQLAEFMKSDQFGQIFVSTTHPGVVRGNHYHHTKVEKFLVLTGDARIRLRHLESSEVHEFTVSGSDYRVIDIPPGYTHSIENVGTSEMTTLFWASEPFDPQKPDTFSMPTDITRSAT